MLRIHILIFLLLIGVADDPDPLRFKSEIDQLASQENIRKNGPGGIMFLGSSSIRMWKSLQEDFTGYPVYNLGFGGSHTSDVLYYFETLVVPFKPILILFYEGDNDLASGKSPNHVFHDFRKFLELVDQELPGTRVGYISAKPSPSRWSLRQEYEKLNDKILSFSRKKNNLTFIDIFSPMVEKYGRPDPALYLEDSLHMTPKGYEIWEKKIRPFIDKEYSSSN
jgi:lysophospholipase L1-like esterase